MDTMRSIRERHSVRAYLEKKIEPEKAAEIRAETEKINAESGLHIQFMSDADGVFGSLFSRAIGWKYVPSYLALVGPDAPGTDEKCGYYGEKLVLFLQSIGLNTCWVGMFKASAVRAEVRPGEKVFITIAVGYGANAGKPHRSKSVSDVTDVKDMPDWFRAGVESALLAPTAINQQKFLFSLDGDVPTARVSGRGPFVDLDLGIVKYHFEAASGRKVR